jgi:hypothetical protein
MALYRHSSTPPLPEVTQSALWDRQQCDVSVNADCRHYIMQTTRQQEKVERCRMNANEPFPFACPDGCLFYEPRKVSQAGWTVRPQDEPPSR